MKKETKAILAILIAMLMLAVVSTVSAVSDEEQEVVELQEINGQFGELLEPTASQKVPSGMMTTIVSVAETSVQTVSRSPYIEEYRRIGTVYGDVAEYKIKIKVGQGEYDSETLTCYVEETSPWRTESDENLMISPGQSLTKIFYSDTKDPESMAIYYAQQGYVVYVLDRREANIGAEETDFSCMEDWTINTYLSDTYYGVIVSRIHTAMLSRNMINDINVSAIGESAGAVILTEYEASKYDDMFLGNIGKNVIIDIVIKYDPAHTELIQLQSDRFDAVTNSIENGTYQNDEMAGMMYIAQMAYIDPSGDSMAMPGFTNIEAFRLMASQTYLFDPYPYTPNFHYWTGDLGGLYYADENRILSATLTGGAVPYSPLVMDQHLAGLMGNVNGYDIDPAKVDSPTLYVGFGGGFSHYGAWWFIEEVGETNNEVTTINWHNQGHASLSLDYNSPELWSLINFWLEN